MTPADDVEADEEAEALRLWNGNGAARLLRRDPSRRALLIERITPGMDISQLPEDEATTIAVQVGMRLWQPAGSPFRNVLDHVPGWLDRADGAGRALVPLARSLLVGGTRASTLVHGDFHHHNILDGGGGRYIAIDAKPMLGEPEYDVFSFLRNPVGTVMSLDRTEKRLAAFAAAGLDGDRMRAWAVIRGAYLSDDPGEVALLRQLL